MDDPVVIAVGNIVGFGVPPSSSIVGDPVGVVDNGSEDARAQGELRNRVVKVTNGGEAGGGREAAGVVLEGFIAIGRMVNEI